ncbi:phosphatase 2C-like domain-containing protein [Mycena polygramma]|nr:phosphatase 2C-like domain-containing protein [Mycena polygramma]
MKGDTFISSEMMLNGGMKASLSALPTSKEDRTVILEFEHGTMIAIFDGHHADELSEYASKHLPQLVAERFDPNASDNAKVITKIFEDFDRALIAKVYQLFDPKEDWLGEHWLDAGNVHEVIGYGKQDPQFRDGRFATVGTTVLMGIIDKDKKHIWVISLGDSDAVCGRMQDGKLRPIMLGDRHNCTNSKEVERLIAEHPGEENLVQGIHVLGLLAVTRALGDHQMKVRSRALSHRIMKSFYPSPIPHDAFEAMDKNNHNTPPYLSATPTIHRYDLQPNDILVFASDGLRDSMHWIPAEDRWDIIIALVNGEASQELGHACIKLSDGDNAAEVLIKNTLFGLDAEKMAKEFDADRDDISVVIVDLRWHEQKLRSGN